MDIQYHRNFTKAFLKLSTKIQDKVESVLEIFQNDPHASQLDNHVLHGKQKGERAISVGGNLRIVFIEKNNYEFVELLNIGSHTQVYK